MQRGKRDGRFEFTLNKGSHSSGNLINLQQTSAIARISMGTTLIEMGEDVDILLV